MCNAFIIVALEPCDLDCPDGYRVDLLGIEVCDCADAVDQLPTASTTTEPTLNPSTFLSDDPAVTRSVSSTIPEISEAPTTAVDSEPIYSGDKEDNLAPPVGQIPCQPLSPSCAKQCLYGYRTDRFGCPRCRCNRCPPFDCSKRCRDGFAHNEAGCRLCRCLGMK